MQALERQAARVAAAVTGEDAGAQNGGANPEEIDLDDGEDDEAEVEVEQRPVPAGVYGDVAQAAESGESKSLGALDRFRSS